MNPTSTSRPSIPSGRNKPGWYAEHDKHVELAKTSRASVLLIGDSLIRGLARYPKVWNQYFSPIKSLNSGLSFMENKKWRDTLKCKNYSSSCLD